MSIKVLKSFRKPKNYFRGGIMSYVFLGDSITAGSSSPFSFTEYMDKDDIYNFGISGTTVGEYSIYPVDGYSLLATYDKIPELRNADEIFLEYGCNDVSAIMCGFTTLQTVIVSFVKAVDGIRQLNPNAEINFLSIAKPYGIIINEFAKYQVDYLSNDYFKGYDFNFPVNLWAQHYTDFVTGASKRCDKVIPMIEDVHFFDKYIAEDNLHPNGAGHKVIAQTIQKYI